jgi:GT2 family glycosyltransferase
MSLKIAVIIVNYNSEMLLQRCLLALEHQTYQPARILVIDNGSDTPLQMDTIKHPFVEIIHLGKNLGFAAANNRGIWQTGDCEWVALLNPDAFPHSDWLAQLVKTAQENTEFACFASHLISAENPEILDGTGDVYHVSGRPWRRDYGKKNLFSRKTEEIFAACAAAAMYKRSALIEVGGFDEQYFCYVEDVDLGFRLRLANYRCLYVPEAVVFHIGSAITGKKSDFFVYYGQRNLIWTYVKNMPGVLFWFYLPQHILLNIFSLFFFTLRGQFKIAFQAKWDALRQLPTILQDRKKIQNLRKISPWQIRQFMAKGLPFRR